MQPLPKRVASKPTPNMAELDEDGPLVSRQQDLADIDLGDETQDYRFLRNFSGLVRELWDINV
jgi:hypothetical protein